MAFEPAIDRRPGTAGYTITREDVTLHVWPMPAGAPALVLAEARLGHGIVALLWTAPFVDVPDVARLDTAQLARLYRHYLTRRAA